jgi:hypothetical protein
MTKPARFENLKRPPADVPLAEMEVEGVRLDLHQKLRLVGMTFGIEPTSATLGWAAVEEVLAVRGGQAIPVSGLALHFTGLSRFEVAFQQAPPGELEYFELRQEGETALLFFFEGGTVRIGFGEIRAELVTEADDIREDDESGPDPVPGSGGGTGFLQ